MANMGYCRFRNALSDLQDCHNNLWEDLSLSPEEHRARAFLIGICKEIAYEVDDEDWLMDPRFEGGGYE